MTRQLVADGADVRVMVRPTANTRSIDDLAVTRFHGDVFDTATLREAMDGCDDVYYCVVDTRAWLRDPAPLFRTNVDGLRNVLDVAGDADLRKFVFTSSYATVGRRHGHVATEDDPVTGRVTPTSNPGSRPRNWCCGTRRSTLCPPSPCVSRRRTAAGTGAAPARRFHRRRGVRQASVLMDGIELEVVGVDDAARALILAAERGRNGERYLISEKMMPLKEVVRIAADEAGSCCRGARFRCRCSTHLPRSAACAPG